MRRALRLGPSAARRQAVREHPRRRARRPLRRERAMCAGLHRFYATERIIYGRPVREALAEEVERLAKVRVLVITNETGPRTEIFQQLKQALGDRVAGAFAVVTAHDSRAEALLPARPRQAPPAD